ncbi:Pycsar system effector family protein, partial [Streptomyces sp. NPDC127084]|uniref:Pycsar system effector family protein n=1 Tax=Streptomyces sp. NPDC127084 TaxID=3347133 RepID=UPI0036639336
MPTTSVSDSAIDKNLDAACTAVSGEIARTDGKASLLLAFDGAILAGLSGLTDRHLPAVTQACGAAAVLALAAAAVLLLLVVRPRLGGGDRASFPYWARLTTSEVYESLIRDSRAACIQALSVIAVRKYHHLRRAVDLSLT